LRGIALDEKNDSGNKNTNSKIRDTFRMVGAAAFILIPCIFWGSVFVSSTMESCSRTSTTSLSSVEDPDISELLLDAEMKKNAPPAQDFYQPQTGVGTEYYIKGNISYNTGERIYHMPGQKYYDSTVIDESAGERWFRSEEEAQAAGWRKSKV
jgi:hypothetical protein